jgi:general stress protein 26
MPDTLTRKDFWTRLEGVQAGMLSLGAGGRPVPMSHYVDPESDTLWFITARGTDLAGGLASGARQARYILASGDGRLYARVDGTASLSQDETKLHEIWSAVADAWFEDGTDDADVALVRLDLSEAEVWATSGSLRFLYEIAKANLTGDKPDTGTHGVLAFAA